jgi:hypothetical protein
MRFWIGINRMYRTIRDRLGIAVGRQAQVAAVDIVPNSTARAIGAVLTDVALRLGGARLHPWAVDPLLMARTRLNR